MSVSVFVSVSVSVRVCVFACVRVLCTRAGNILVICLLSPTGHAITLVSCLSSGEISESDYGCMILMPEVCY